MRSSRRPKLPIDALLTSVLEEVVGTSDLSTLEQIRVRVLGKKGELTAQLKALGAMDPEDLSPTRRSARRRNSLRSTRR